MQRFGPCIWNMPEDVAAIFDDLERMLERMARLFRFLKAKAELPGDLPID